MESKPILLFGSKEPATWKNPQTPITTKHVFPSHGTQSTRLSQKFTALQGVIDKGRLSLQNTPVGIEPEYTLVFEIGDDVEAFYRAVRYLNDGAQATRYKKWYTDNGFAEIVFDCLDEVSAETEFYQKDSKGDRRASVDCKFYCVSANITAMSQILSLWNSYKQNENFEFPRGKTGFRDVFKQLKDIRRWGTKERLEETGILDDWREMITGAFTVMHCEIELVYTGNPAKQQTRESEVTTLINAAGLEDKNGKMIFEGDLLVGLIGSRSENLKWKYKGIVVFRNGAFTIQNVFSGYGETKDGFYENIKNIGFSSFRDYEVIGNTHDQCRFLGLDSECQKHSDEENIVYCVQGPCEEILNPELLEGK